jgi:Tfp pilus assembly major pilin PilA
MTLDTERQLDWRRYEMIVGERSGHYLPRFRRFAKGGWISWNWAAFFATYAWLRYRKLYGWSWLYVLWSTPFLLIYSMLPLSGSGDSCEAALSQSSVEPFYLVIGALVVLGWIVPPLAADRLYFARVRALAAKAERAATEGRDAEREFAKRSGSSRTAGYGALVFQALITVIAAIAVPGYGSYVYRARVSEGISLLVGAKTPLEEYVKDRNGRLPDRINDVAGTTSGRYVKNIELKADGTIRATFGDSAQRLTGHSVLMVPSWKNGTIVAWSCRSDDLPDKCLPASCRKSGP